MDVDVSVKKFTVSTLGHVVIDSTASLNSPEIVINRGFLFSRFGSRITSNTLEVALGGFLGGFANITADVLLKGTLAPGIHRTACVMFMGQTEPLPYASRLGDIVVGGRLIIGDTRAKVNIRLPPPPGSSTGGGGGAATSRTGIRRPAEFANSLHDNVKVDGTFVMSTNFTMAISFIGSSANTGAIANVITWTSAQISTGAVANTNQSYHFGNCQFNPGTSSGGDGVIPPSGTNICSSSSSGGLGVLLDTKACPAGTGGSQGGGTDSPPPECPANCNGALRGNCLASGQCQCFSPYFGPTCADVQCAAGCFGTCDGLSGTAVCECPRVNGTHWSYGDSCELIAEGCPPCENGSTCDGSQCVCGSGRRGNQCTIPVCPGYEAATNSSNCNGNGLCVDGGCVCVGGYTGTDCSQRSATTQTTAPSTSSGISTGVIVAIVVSVLAVAVAAAIIGAIIHRRRTQAALNSMSGKIERANA